MWLKFSKRTKPLFYERQLKATLKLAWRGFACFFLVCIQLFIACSYWILSNCRERETFWWLCIGGNEIWAKEKWEQSAHVTVPCFKMRFEVSCHEIICLQQNMLKGGISILRNQLLFYSFNKTDKKVVLCRDLLSLWNMRLLTSAGCLANCQGKRTGLLCWESCSQTQHKRERRWHGSKTTVFTVLKSLTAFKKINPPKKSTTSMLLLEQSHVRSIRALFPRKMNVDDLPDFIMTLWNQQMR